MNMTNLAYAENLEEEKETVFTEKLNSLPDSTWNYFVKEMKKVFRFTHKETKWFKNCKTAKLIATIPFAAGCDEPERTAIAHLCIYMAEIRGFQKYCAHLPSDDSDLFKRLGFIATFEGGDKEIIEYGMNMLALTMIEGYHKTEKEDEKNGVYNPFVSGGWDYNTLKRVVTSKMNKKSSFYKEINVNEVSLWQ